MPVDWADQDQVQRFRTSAMQQPGANSLELESYITKKTSGIKEPSITPLTVDTGTALSLEHSPLTQNAPAPLETVKPPSVAPMIPAIEKPQETMAPSLAPTPLPVAPVQQEAPQIIQKGILPTVTKVTQMAGTRNSVEAYSGGVSRDTNFRAAIGTDVALPPGTWKIVSSYNGADNHGVKGRTRSANQGYGNAVMAVNQENGDKMIFQHLSAAEAKEGDVLKGGTRIGKTGNSGNSTGPNLGIEYQDKDGRIREVTRSQYAPYLFAQ